MNLSPFVSGKVCSFPYRATLDTTIQASSSVRPCTLSRSNSHFDPASITLRILKWFSVGIFFIFLRLACVLSFWSFLLAHSVDLEVSLEVESDEDPDSKLRFEECGNVVGVILRVEEGFVVGSPTGLLISRPTSLLELLCENSVGGGPVLASVSNVDTVEVVLQEISG